MKNKLLLLIIAIMILIAQVYHFEKEQDSTEILIEYVTVTRLIDFVTHNNTYYYFQCDSAIDPNLWIETKDKKNPAFGEELIYYWIRNKYTDNQLIFLNWESL